MSKNEVQRAVEQLKLDGYQVRFTHWRRTAWGEVVRYSRKVKWMYNNGGAIAKGVQDYEDDYGEPMSSGGMTQCSIIFTWLSKEVDPEDIEELVTQSVTHCSKDDQFCYAQGRRISLARAIKQMEVGLPYLDKEVYDPLRGELWRHAGSLSQWLKTKTRGATCRT